MDDQQMNGAKPRLNGTVKFFNAEKRFGFIAAEDGKEYFVHQSGLQPGVMVAEGDAVTFQTEDSDKGPKAVNVAKAGAGDDSGAAAGSSDDMGDDASAPTE